MTPGTVYIVGAGPGDPGLVTIRAAELLRDADCVVFDALVTPEVMRLVGPHAERIPMGKRGGSDSAPQSQIEELLMAKAWEGKRVVRLKGGDPFLFGRGAEEALVLRNAGVPFEVVPGVTSAIAAPAYAGVPVTHREVASSVTFVTGHEDPSQPISDINFSALTGSGTVVFLMAIAHLGDNLARLVVAGRDPATPACAIEWGTTAEQRTVVGTVGSLADAVALAHLESPSVVVVGEVVRFRDALNWFERRPLFGRTVMVTRTREQAFDFSERLRGAGAKVLEFPTIGVVPPESWARLDQAIQRIDSFQWIVFTSANGVKFFFQRLWDRGFDLRRLASLKVAAIGPRTAEVIEERGIRVDIVPSEASAEALAVAFGDVAGAQVLFPRAAEGRDVLPDELTKRGANVLVVPAYRTGRAQFDAEAVRNAFQARAVDAITFTSASTVKNFAASFGPGEAALLTKNVVTACIGPITADAARDVGITPTIVSTTYTIEALADLLIAHFSKGTPPL